MRISECEYLALFPESLREKSFNHALDIRKFEIELYWKRATYFWTLIGASFAGYAALASKEKGNVDDLLVIVSCLGFLFSFAWHCVNRGSKQWQENWENHVDMLEDKVIGPLYKTVLRRRDPESAREVLTGIFTAPARISVSGVNQIISIYVCLIWAILIYHSLPIFSVKADVSILYSLIIGSLLLTCALFIAVGRTHTGPHGHIADKRNSNII